MDTKQSQAAPPTYEAYLTPAELSTRWKVSRETLKRMRKEGRLSFHKMGRMVRFKLSDVTAFEAASRV